MIIPIGPSGFVLCVFCQVQIIASYILRSHPHQGRSRTKKRPTIRSLPEFSSGVNLSDTLLFASGRVLGILIVHTVFWGHGAIWIGNKTFRFYQALPHPISSLGKIGATLYPSIRRLKYYERLGIPLSVFSIRQPIISREAVA